ncbi:MAG TPA: hypothetical protein VMK82_05965 [Steroidobacteraceae bacterium]|nr:hypothetical protein [Steroidobacteraceae bacterium]
MPAVVTGEGEPYRPEVLFWMDTDGLIQGSTVDKPGVLLPQAGARLSEAISVRLCGGGKPIRIRVASPELATVLREAHPRLDIVCAPTPELDEMLAQMCATMGSEGTQQQSYLSAGIEPGMVASFFQAAAELFRSQPWKIVPGDQSLIEVSIEALELRHAVICVIGQMGESFGLLLFPGVPEFDAYLEAAAAENPGPGPHSKWPRFFSLNFERGADLDPGLRKQIAAHGWKVAGRDAYPWPVAVEKQLLPRPPSARELRMFEAISRALARLMSEASGLREAWQGGQSVSRTAVVPTHQGDVEVTLQTLTRRVETGDPIIGLLELELDGEELDPDERARLEMALLDEFAASAEGAGRAHGGNCSLVMDLAADYLGCTITGLDADGLREILFEVLPRKASIGASEAPAIVDELQAFYQFLKRAYDFSGADDCLRVLRDGAAAKLQAALSDSSKFGMAKSLFMAGREAGFDMSTQEGLDAWMLGMQGKTLPASIQMPFPGLSPAVPGKKAKAKKKSKRKSARAARRKSR